MLSTTQLDHYHTQGFVIPDFRLDKETLDTIKGHHERLITRLPEFRDYCPSVLAYDLAFLNYARIPEILEMVEQVLGGHFALWNSSFFAKPAVNGRATPWHQDGEYWPIRPVATCTVWIAIDDANTENGCLKLIPGSHKKEQLLAHKTNPDPNLTLNQELLSSDFDESQAVDLILEAGQMSLHDVRIVHGSEENTSSNSRRGMTLRYMPLTSVFDRRLAVTQSKSMGFKAHEERTLFLMRGTDQTGENDFRLRW
ncbi:MAG: phytanoyl-CoA dioxygenase family protein [Gammaproteobacteria bacterium]|jgi:ectoine hydroxylase-related dioxygenase (phytanoyl-CoA dioxygenase family)|nr:phytanoyl-CoA dioxygenase family protein [Gammaproteobacteria bacterium]RTZ65743.1 MAG: phytanoyl-CoA dioxygenase family protein [Gammaproteobacteria bacterium]HHZ71785.1 phytanoyl-CoA dioxygenase family protein [Gammaproteobacteria bacterium]HIN43408.1 phytanoyl-CoA dioxygenase family protein [Gammaproteobacteria bacterium]HIO18758.1 phytanoyl-CoA dioxygenase family protein [Gammaproteobacteria bacterium]|tara:strand:+ start:307 stop:1068 length:762 start_codon:yes stop_codon:yes gene_type:complete